MNIRVTGIVLIVILFALTSGYMSYSVSSGDALNEVYNKENIQIIQSTSAGTVPHEINIKNNGNNAIKVKKGEVLSSSISPDMILAEDKTIVPNSNETVKAFSLEPSKRVNVGSKLLPVNTTYDSLNQVINEFNSSDKQSAINTQLEIWIIMSGGSLNPYTGEPVDMVEKNDITWSKLRQNISDAKTNIMNTFNVNESEVSNLKNKDINAGQTWIDNISDYIKSSLGI
ncbi:hypothetical protein [Methanobacterium oryzae]|uniref:hypothetical protein n=1 Tax=Methanobacterium oryzae TaxID=69540 RepID=UPI003D1F1892